MHQAVQGWSKATHFNQFKRRSRNFSETTGHNLSTKTRFEIQHLLNRFRWLAIDFFDAKRVMMLLRTQTSVVDAHMISSSTTTKIARLSSRFGSLLYFDR
ncbi:hypothetical protein ACN47E_000777 [Coniothyrium glycines]